MGSARKDSDTRKVVEQLFAPSEIRLLDLLDIKVCPYNYAGTYPPDDAFPTLTEALLQHDHLVFATPVYWYAMSGLLKVFFDRLTDIVTIHKKTGRRLLGKKTFLVAVGAEETLPEGFEAPFQLTSGYLGMAFTGTYYHHTRDKVPASASIFLKNCLYLTSNL